MLGTKPSNPFGIGIYLSSGPKQLTHEEARLYKHFPNLVYDELLDLYLLPVDYAVLRHRLWESRSPSPLPLRWTVVQAQVHRASIPVRVSIQRSQPQPQRHFPTLHLTDIEVCVLGLHLAKELCEVDEDGDCWLQVTRKIPMLPTLFTALEISLRLKQNLHFTEASLHLLLTLARTQQGAAALAGAGIMQSICLPLLSVYQLSTNGAGQVPPTSRKSLDAPSWPGVYRLSISLMERLLKTLRYNFLTDALDFVGVHQERILQCLNAVRTVQSLACLEEADHTVGFILQLSNFMKEWHFHLPQLLRDVQVGRIPGLPDFFLAFLLPE
ncbi:hypothetical protein JD844_004640 [Phrynosoma platyrhinos]|uniref:Uncharacterized protein n=1 Tax=Phrynosoma platyrhinos TaxID=52577 RepID=A0ABQ7SDM7_PHRPL|nr:hypothetical protein JD844_004640 [Phrynosoma platyrhinos]